MKPIIDFSVHSDPYWIKVADYSMWNLIEEGPSIIEVTLPGYGTPVTKYFDKHKTNGFNSIVLGMNCIEPCEDTDLVTLPDGIYTIKVIGSPSKFNKEKYYLKTDLLDMEIDKIFIDSIEKDDYNKIEKRLTEITFLIKGAESHIRYDNITIASSMFQKATEMVDKMKTCRYC
jgi:hypothetical protein